MDILMYIGAIIVLIIVLKIISIPIKIICKFVVNSVVAGIILYFLAKFGIFMVITWWSVLLTGLFGIPGLILSFILSIFIV